MKVKFSDCVEYMIKGPFGSDMKKSLYVPKGENTYKVYVQGNAIQKNENLGDYYISSEYFHKKLERFQVHPGDYIITCDGTLGKYIKLSENIEPGVISSSLLLLRLDESRIYDKFFELIWDNSMLKYLASQARNACLVHLPSAKAIGEVEIDLPEMSIQQDIADKAFFIKDIVNKRNEEMGLLDELIKARFVEMFGDPNIEFRYETYKFKEFASDMTKGPFGSDMKKDLFVQKGEDTYKVYIQANAIQGDQNIGDYYISKEYFNNKICRFEVHPGDYIITCDGTLGKHLKLNDEMEKGVISPSLLRLTLNEEKMTSEYFEYLWDMYMLLLMKKEARNACLVHLPSAKVIGEIDIPVPPFTLQEDFSRFVQQTDKSKVVVQKALEEAQLLFDSLMQKYFG